MGWASQVIDSKDIYDEKQDEIAKAEKLRKKAELDVRQNDIMEQLYQKRLEADKALGLKLKAESEDRSIRKRSAKLAKIARKLRQQHRRR